jgi:transcription initiation factor TFIIIB Brf1 subunit/transcription initiation factor TFIIB
MKELCPICSSNNVVVERYQGTMCIVCQDCGYDEKEDLDTSATFKTNQKAKSENNPYKTGRKSKF